MQQKNVYYQQYIFIRITSQTIWKRIYCRSRQRYLTQRNPIKSLALVNKPYLRLLGAALIALQLFAQAAFATQPCITSGMSDALAMSHQSDSDCCTSSAAAINLCATKCVDSDKLSAHTPQPVLPAPTVTTLNPWYRSDTAVVAAHYPHDPRDPPRTIRFCSIQI